jgi:hypothetical protein
VLFQKAKRGLELISYRVALLSTLLHAAVYVYKQFTECTGTLPEPQNSQETDLFGMTSYAPEFTV